MWIYHHILPLMGHFTCSQLALLLIVLHFQFFFLWGLSVWSFQFILSVSLFANYLFLFFFCSRAVSWLQCSVLKFMILLAFKNYVCFPYIHWKVINLLSWIAIFMFSLQIYFNMLHHHICTKSDPTLWPWSNIQSAQCFLN